MNFTQLQLLLMNDELHYNESNKSEFILYEYTIHDFTETRNILRKNNIKHSVYTDSNNLDYIMI
jgi:hypothetical protein